MHVHIIRGQNQIGGSIIEVGSASTRIVLDVGSELNEAVPVVPEVEGLFQGEARYGAVLVSHYHGDHIGLHPNVLPGIPVYMGERACRAPGGGGVGRPADGAGGGVSAPGGTA